MSTQPVNAEAPQEQGLVPKRERVEVAAFDPGNPIAVWMNTGLFEQMQRVATLLSKSELLPKHLQGKPADCFLVVAQAFRWGFDPFAVAQSTFVTSGKLGYEGKLIAAVINTSGKLSAPLNYRYSGSGVDRAVTVSGQFKGETEPRLIEGSVKGWQTQNQKWKEMPDQMLAYRGAREWARRHMPEAVLGVQADEEVVEAITVAPLPEEPRVSALEAAKERLRASTREAAATPITEEPKPEEVAAGPCKHTPLWRIAAHTDPGKRLVCPDCSGEFTPAEISAARKGE